MRYTYKLTFIHYSSMVLHPFVGPWPFLQFRNLFYPDGRTPWTSDQPNARPLPIHRTTQTQNKRMPCVGFEPTIPVFERAKTIHALYRAATVIGINSHTLHNSTPKMEAEFTPETWAILPTSTSYNTRTKLTSIINHSESLKSGIIVCSLCICNLHYFPNRGGLGSISGQIT
jgi:hypothetical protein